MAQKITLKRVIDTSGNTDDLFPTTTLDQIYTVDGNGAITATSLSTYLDDTFIPLSQKGANSGVATLTSGGKLTTSQVPDYIFNGLKYAGAISYSTPPSIPLDLKTLITGTLTTNYTLTAQLDSFLPSGVTDFQDIGQNYIGYYWSVNAPLSIADVASAGEADWTTVIFDDGVAPATVDFGGTNYANTLSLEVGDFVIVTGFDNAVQGGRFKVGVINNTYGNASADLTGVVKLTDATNAGQYNASTNTDGLVNGATEVITENFLFDNIASGEMNGGASGANNVLNKIASTNHLHDGRYYTETEIDNWIAGTSSINSKNFTEIIYGSTPSSTTVGTILIDID